jgi:hypothetical protein
MDSNGRGFVNVPWSDTNTTYTFTNKSATLSWGTAVTIATVGGVNITATLPSNPNTDYKASTYASTGTKLYLVGATSQSSATTTGVQTYSNVNCYIGTDNCLYSNGSKVLTSYTNTLNTAGASNSTSKLYLIGATSQNDGIQTYSNSSCYVSGGYLYSNGVQVNMGAYLPLSGGTMTGTINSMNIIPKYGNSYDLGSSDNYWYRVYSNYTWTNYTYLNSPGTYAAGGRSKYGTVTINSTSCIYYIIEINANTSNTFSSYGVNYSLLLISLRISKSAFARTTKY